MRSVKRPAVLVFMILAALIICVRFIFAEKTDRKNYKLDKYFITSENNAPDSPDNSKERQIPVMVKGTVSQITLKKTPAYPEKKDLSSAKYEITLTDVTIDIYGETYHTKALLACYQDEARDLDKKIRASSRYFIDTGSFMIRPGDIFTFSGRLQRPLKARNPGGFDQRKYLGEKNIYYILMNAEPVRKIKTGKKMKVFLYRIKDMYAKSFADTYNEENAGIITAMLLGDKSMLDPDIKDLYTVNGIGHLLAISGLHVGIIGGAFFTVFRLIGLNFNINAIASSLFVILYGSMTDFPVSTSRACIMFIISLLAIPAGRTYDPAASMSLSALFIILQKPLSIFTASFLLSYAAVLAIYLVSDPVSWLFYGSSHGAAAHKLRLNTRNRELNELKRDTTLQQYITSVLEKLKESFFISLSIQVVTLPIIMYSFYQIPLYGVLLNIFVIPAASFAVIISMLTGTLGFLALAAGNFFHTGLPYMIALVPMRFLAGSADMILNAAKYICKLIQKLPYANIITGAPALWKIPVYYLILFMMICLMKGKLKVKTILPGNPVSFISKRVNILITAVYILTVIMLFGPGGPSSPTVTFLDVGQGDCSIIRYKNKTFIIDCGSVTQKDTAKYVLVPFLKYNGTGMVDAIIMSHADEDHISGLAEFMSKPQGIKIGCLLMPDVYLKDRAYMGLIKTAENNKIPYELISRGDRIIIKGNNAETGIIHGKKRYIKEKYHMEKNVDPISLQMISPGKGFVTEGRNAYSTVLKLDASGTRFYFTGDCEKEGEQELIRYLSAGRISGRSDISPTGQYDDPAGKNDKSSAQENDISPAGHIILKVPHHGSNGTSSAELLSLLDPDINVISCGKGNSYGHPGLEALSRLSYVNGHTAHTYITMNTGAVTIRTNAYGKIVLKTYLK
jgi:competence protein ComEC